MGLLSVAPYRVIALNMLCLFYIRYLLLLAIALRVRKSKQLLVLQ